MQGSRPRKEVLVDKEQQQNLLELAGKLETIAQKLKETGTFTIVDGQRELVVDPVEPMEVGYKFQCTGNVYRFELDVNWQADGSTPDVFTIE